MTSRIGKHTAQALAKLGAVVLVHGRSVRFALSPLLLGGQGCTESAAVWFAQQEISVVAHLNAFYLHTVE